MFYEEKHSAKKDYFSISQGYNINFTFPLHLHENYEFFFVEEGVLSVEINGISYKVNRHEGAFILPNQPHAYSTTEHSKTWGVIFSPDHIPELKKIIASKGHFFPIITLGDRDIKSELMRCRTDPLRLRSILYELAAMYTDGARSEEPSLYDSDTVSKLVAYIDAHYTEPMTLTDVSQALGYSYRYMSGIINSFFKLSLPQIVNKYRVTYACQQLTETQRELTEIAFCCGFGSIRSFNRNFKEVMGITPREYRLAQH
ncbi:MAG: helix-turn-helix domain-containing protein [Clostridia bacterium]|nr:helix-turn-helix domain-containing protein [Clostridia bacterium]